MSAILPFLKQVITVENSREVQRNIAYFSSICQMCLGHTWYLAVDMQLFILAPILFLVAYR